MSLNYGEHFVKFIHVSIQYLPSSSCPNHAPSHSSHPSHIITTVTIHHSYFFHSRVKTQLSPPHPSDCLHGLLNGFFVLVFLLFFFGSVHVKGKRWWICIAPRRENLTSKVLRCGSHSLTCQYTTPAFTHSSPGGATTEWTVTAPAD